jgi:hypothetical protein
VGKKVVFVDSQDHVYLDGHRSGYLKLRDIHLSSVPKVELSLHEFESNDFASLEAYLEHKQLL